MKNKKGPSQNWSRSNNEKNEHNEHAARTNEYKEVIDHHGSINPAPSKITQFFRKFKANPFVQNIAKVGVAIAPIGVISKAKVVKNIGGAFGNTAKQYLSKSKSIGNMGGAFGNTAKQYLGKGGNMGGAFGNTANQYLGKSIGTKSKRIGMKEYRVDGKLYGHFDKSGKLTNKHVPVVGKPGTTVQVPKTSSTQQVSFVNSRISMTAAERKAAGY